MNPSLRPIAKAITSLDKALRTAAIPAWITRDRENDGSGGHAYLHLDEPAKRHLVSTLSRPAGFWWDSVDQLQLKSHYGLRAGQIQPVTITFVDKRMKVVATKAKRAKVKRRAAK